MSKSMNLLALAISLAVAGTISAAPPVSSKEFTYDEKVNKEMAQRLKIPVYFAVPGSARLPLPTTIDTTDRLIDFKHPDGKGAQGDVGLRLLVAKRAGFAQRMGKAGLIQTGDVPVIGPEIGLVGKVRVLDHTSRGVRYAGCAAGQETCAGSHGRRLFCCLH